MYQHNGIHHSVLFNFLKLDLITIIYHSGANRLDDAIPYNKQTISIFRLIKNPILKTYCPNGYVLKVANTLDSEDEAFFEGQTEIMHLLQAQHIICPVPVQNIFGKYQSLEKIGDGKHIVRLLEYVPGKVFHGVPHTDRLFYEAGTFIAQIDSALKVG